jgi:hypothetical protein
MERETGIEPATTGLGSRCSTIELLPLVPSQNNITAPWPSPLGINARRRGGRKGTAIAYEESSSGRRRHEVFRAGQEARDELADV